MTDINNLINLHIQLDNVINIFWQVFITVNAAIIGWLISKKEVVSSKNRIIGCLTYSFFAAFVYLSISGKSEFYEAVNNDLTQVAIDNTKFLEDSKLQEYLIKLDKPTWDGLWRWVFLSSAIIVNLFIYFSVFISKPAKEQNEDQELETVSVES